MHEFMYHQILADRKKLEYYAQNEIFSGLAFYHFCASFCRCQICRTLDNCYFSVDNPDLIKLARFLSKECHSRLELRSYLEIEQTGISIVNKGDALLNKLLSNSPYKKMPFIDYGKYSITTSRKKIVQDVLKINRQQNEILDCSELPHIYPIYEFLKNYQYHDGCALCETLRGLYIAEDSPYLDMIVKQMGKDCTITIQPIAKDKMNSTKRKKLNADALTIKRLMDNLSKK